MDIPGDIEVKGMVKPHLKLGTTDLPSLGTSSMLYVYILQVHFTTVISRTLPSNRPLLGTCTYIIGSVHSQVNAHVHVHVLLESGKFSSMHACIHYIILGERNRRIPREACCSSETMQYRTHSCQFVLNHTNRAIERTILGDIVARLSAKSRQKR